jgi:DNA-directed RNA polymerase specialized sigma subunit
VAESDKRIKEIKRTRAKLSDHESRAVTPELIARFIELYKEEHLETSLADAYELAALNYNYLGYAREAAKYATLSAQAGSIEGGVNSNNAMAMRIMAKDPVGHYSYRMKLKK